MIISVAARRVLLVAVAVPSTFAVVAARLGTLWAGSMSVVFWVLCTTLIVAYVNEQSGMRLDSKLWQKESTLAFVPLVVSGFVFAFQAESGPRFLALGAGLLLGNLLLWKRTFTPRQSTVPLGSYVAPAAVSGFWMVPVLTHSVEGWLASMLVIAATLTLVNWLQCLIDNVEMVSADKRR